MVSESTPTSTPTDAAPGQPPLATLVARAPDLVRRMLAAAAQEAASETDPHLPERRCTAIIATYCEHLAAMEMTVYSVARRRLPGGEQAVAVVEALAHDAELVMREMEERIGGDRFAAAGPFAQLQDRLEVAFAAHVEAERALVGRLQGRLAPAEHAALVTRLDSALRHAPTRPHPYGPHTSRLTPLAFPAARAGRPHARRDGQPARRRPSAAAAGAARQVGGLPARRGAALLGAGTAAGAARRGWPAVVTTAPAGTIWAGLRGLPGTRADLLRGAWTTPSRRQRPSQQGPVTPRGRR